MAVYLCGPLPGCNETNNMFIFTAVDTCTRHPIAIPLVRHTAEDILSTFGQSAELLSDKGSDLTSHLWREVMRVLKVNHTYATIAHPMTQGLCEKYNGTLKRCLKSLVDSFPDNWDKALPFVLWSYRECPVEGLTFSPFELLFNRQPPGPLALLKDSWMSKLLVKPQMKHVFNYIHDMKNKMQASLDITKEETKIARSKSKRFYDRNAVERSLHVGQLVLMYLPVNGKPLATKLHGPYKVLEHKDTVNYLIVSITQLFSTKYNTPKNRTRM